METYRIERRTQEGNIIAVLCIFSKAIHIWKICERRQAREWTRCDNVDIVFVLDVDGSTERSLGCNCGDRKGRAFNCDSGKEEKSKNKRQEAHYFVVGERLVKLGEV